MNFRRQFLYSTLTLFTLFIANAIVLDHYYTNYHTNTLIKYRLFQLRFRCYRYYDIDLKNELTNIICTPYKYDYILFSLDRSRYIALCYGLNLIYIFFSILIISII